jgi:hypothetical protein
MPAEARVTKLWKQQKGLIPLMFIAFALYFGWDGAVGYPRSDERFKAHEQRKDQPGEWEKYCAERGWKTEVPEKWLGPAKYAEQFWWGGSMGFVGLLALAYWMRQKRTVVRNDAESVTTASGTRVPYTAITHVDQTKWKSKGLAYIRYALEGGRQGRFKLDDAKHDPKALDIILADITEHVTGKATIEG